MGKTGVIRKIIGSHRTGLVNWTAKKKNYIPTIIYATNAPAGPAWATDDPLERKIPVPMVPPMATTSENID
jgi:hypothetical protein